MTERGPTLGIVTNCQGLVRPGPGSSAGAWRGWAREQTYKQVDIAGIGSVETWVELAAVALPLVSFQTTFIFASDGATLTSHSTLGFRGREEIAVSLRAVGLAVEEGRDALTGRAFYSERPRSLDEHYVDHCWPFVGLQACSSGLRSN